MPQTMEALVFRAPGEWGLEAFPVPTIQRDDDVLLKVNAASICGTDLHMVRGTLSGIRLRCAAFWIAFTSCASEHD